MVIFIWGDYLLLFQFSSVALQPHGRQDTRRPCPSYLPEFAQTHVHRVNDAIQSSHPLSPPSLVLNLSSKRVFSSESVLHIRWPKYWSSSISPSNEYSGLISFRMDWFDLLPVQGTLKRVFFSTTVWINSSALSLLNGPSHPYMAMGKTMALTIRTFVSKVMSLLFNVVPRFVIAFVPRGKCLLISWL